MMTLLKLLRLLGEGPRIESLIELANLFFLSRLTLILKRLVASILCPLLALTFLLAQPDPTNAAKGGRIGGGSFRAPSIPRTGGYGGGYRGGYGGGYRGGYRGGGIGFPFILPFFGFGGGGLFGFLIMVTIAGVLVNAIRGTNNSSGSISSYTERTSIPSPITIIQVQIGLLASAKKLQEDLRRIAASSDTNNQKGLQNILQETTLALLRQPDLWTYANVESGSVPFASSESTFNKLSMTERSKLEAEITSNVSGNISSQSSSQYQAGEADALNEYIVATLLIATNNKLKISNDNQNLLDTLRILGSISSSELIALEVIWQPEGKGDVLSAEALVTSYPNLKHL